MNRVPLKQRPIWQRLHWSRLLLVLNVLLSVGCSQASPPISPTVTALPGGVLQAELRTLQSSTTHLDLIVAELQQLAAAAPWRSKGFFDAEQQDQIENLLFRFLACRHTLWQLANHHLENDVRYPTEEAKAKNSAIAFNAGFHLVLYDALFVKAFRGDAIAVAKLNEEFYRSRIPAQTFDRLLHGVTNERQLEGLRNAFLLYAEGLVQSGSSLVGTAQQPDYRNLVASTQAVAVRADAMVQELVKTEYRLLPSLDNRLRHTRVASLLGESENETGELLSVARAHLFKGISRIKNPEAHLIKFSPEQKRQVVDLLQPGDIILTYTAGYMSDIFIPGSFKHAITYVGSVGDRQLAGLTADRLTWIPEVERGSLLTAISTAKITSGEEANIIEAVGEGVIFNHLGHIMDTHINRMLILRPQVSDEERGRALAQVFRFLGDGYDFKFDFADASEQVCTEVVYRALDGKGAIRFTLTKRAGHPTLSADDIANSYLAAPGKTFEFVLLAEEMPNSPEHHAQILVDSVGSQRLIDLMPRASNRNQKDAF